MEYAAKFETLVIAGIVIIRSKKMLNYLVSNIPGVVVPQWLIDRTEGLKDEDVKKFGIEFASSTILSILERKLCNGIHIMAFSRVEEVKNLLDFIRI